MKKYAEVAEWQTRKFQMLVSNIVWVRLPSSAPPAQALGDFKFKINVDLKNKPHMWNEVFLNGKWSTIDLTPCYKTFMGKLRTKQNNNFTIHEEKSAFERG